MNKEVQSQLESMNLCIDQKEFNHAAAVGQILMNILNVNKELDLVDLENYLREMKSRVYLLALPMGFFNNGDQQYMSVFPDKENLQENALWICMNGENEASAMMQQNNLTKELNLEKLKRCGFLMVAPQPSLILN